MVSKTEVEEVGQKDIDYQTQYIAWCHNQYTYQLLGRGGKYISFKIGALTDRYDLFPMTLLFVSHFQCYFLRMTEPSVLSSCRRYCYD